MCLSRISFCRIFAVSHVEGNVYLLSSVCVWSVDAPPGDLPLHRHLALNCQRFLVLRLYPSSSLQVEGNQREDRLGDSRRERRRLEEGAVDLGPRQVD